MKNFGFFKNLTQITYGAGALQEVEQIVKKEGFKKVLIITDHGISQTHLINQLTSHLEDVEYKIYAETQPNPTVSNCKAALAVLQEIEAEMVVAIGGGSSIDVAKAVALLATNGGSIEQYEGIDTCQQDLLPLIAIPTTAGTASEVTTFTVITNEEKQYKLTVGGIRLAPKWALVDPEVTLTLPPSITAATGLDALVHAIESYTSKMANPITKTLAREAIRKISRNLRQAVYGGDNLAARDQMMMGSLLAGLAFNNTRLGNCHAMSHPVSAIYGVPHGIANAVIIPHVMDFNSYAVPELFGDIAEDMGMDLKGLSLMEKAAAAATAVRALSDDIGIPGNLAELGVDLRELDRMAKDAMLSGNIAVNSRITKYDDIIELYKKVVGQTDEQVKENIELALKN